ncbi:MAG: hypothetical protein ACJ762_16340 [Solirubrobacteraceae bacterium]
MATRCRRLVLLTLALLAVAPSAANAALADKLVLQLGNGAQQKVGGEAMGWVLASIGLGSPESAMLADIRQQLVALQKQVAELRRVVEHTRADVLDLACQTAVQHAVPIIADTDSALDQMKMMADTSDDASRHKIAQRLEEFIHTHLLSKQQALHDLLSGGSASAGLIVTCARSLEYSYRPFVSPRHHPEVAQFVHYYTESEALLLALRVEYWHATHQSGDFISERIAIVRDWIKAQEAYIKPQVPPHTFLDKRSKTMWRGAVHVITGTQIRKNHWSRSTRFSFDGYHDWRLASLTEVTKLFHGWRGFDAPNWVWDLTGQFTLPEHRTCWWGAETAEGWAPTLDTGYTMNLNGLTGDRFRRWMGYTCYIAYVRAEPDIDRWAYTEAA